MICWCCDIEQEHATDAIRPASMVGAGGTEETQRVCCSGTTEVHPLMQTLWRILCQKHWTHHWQQRSAISFFCTHWWRTTNRWMQCTVTQLTQLMAQSLGCAICQTVNCRQPSFSGCRSPHLEFFTGARRHGNNTPVLQETLENVLTATIVLTSTLVVLEVTSVT